MANKLADKVTLYIATHNITGKKYFGKTTRWFTTEDLQEKYHGSGTYWLRHLKKHGNDVTMEIHGIFSLDGNSPDYVEPIALEFSEENNIANCNNWANLKDEDGLRGGSFSEESKHKIGQSNKIALAGRKQTEEHKRNSGNAQIGMKRSKESKKNMSEARMGMKFTEEHKDNLSISAKNKPPMTAETKLKLSLAAKQQWKNSGKQNNIL